MALASLTANYTDSDVSDSDDDKDTKSSNDKHQVLKKQPQQPFKVTPLIYSQPQETTETLTATFSKINQHEPTEMGHITVSHR